MAYTAPLSSIGEDLQRVETALLQIAPPDYPELGSIFRNLVQAGGKRIRPALVLLAARFNTYDLDNLLHGAVAVELLHTASLVHDDTIDQAAMRRGKPTVNTFLPDSAAILIGDYIFAQSAISSATPGNAQVVYVFANTLREICDGELRQALGNHRLNFNREEYFHRIYAKTAALFACSAEIGALLSNAPQEQRRTLRTYGEKLGQAYQVIDDILDFSDSSEQSGKPIGEDLLQGTATLPTIIYLEQLSGADGNAQTVLDALRGAEGADYARAFRLIRESGALSLARAEAAKLADEACAALLELPPGEERNSLHDLAAYVLDRDR